MKDNTLKWTLIVICLMMVGVFFVGCGTRGDGEDDLWIGVQHVERNQ